MGRPPLPTVQHWLDREGRASATRGSRRRARRTRAAVGGRSSTTNWSNGTSWTWCLLWLRDSADSENLPEPEVLAAAIVEDPNADPNGPAHYWPVRTEPSRERASSCRGTLPSPTKGGASAVLAPSSLERRTPWIVPWSRTPRSPVRRFPSQRQFASDAGSVQHT